MRENLKMIKEKDMGNYIFLMEINMKVNFIIIKDKGMNILFF